jgi:hypothetical protein
MNSHQVRVIRPHNETSPGWKDYHEMVLIGRRNDDGTWTEHERRDSIGRLNRGGKRWHIAVCNNTECRAEMVVQLDEILADLADAVPRPRDSASARSGRATP